jgi:hypothetical protein
VHLSAFMLVINQLDAQNLFYNKFILSQPVHGTATYRCDETRGCSYNFDLLTMSTWCSKHVEAWNKLILNKFFASSWLITKIKNNICLYFYFPLDIMFRSIDHHQVIFTKLRIRCVLRLVSPCDSNEHQLHISLNFLSVTPTVEFSGNKWALMWRAEDRQLSKHNITHFTKLRISFIN